MCHQSQGSSAAMDQCCCSKISDLISGPISEGVLTTNPIPKGIPKVEASSSCPIIEEKEKEQEEEGEIVEVSDSEDDFGVFNQPLS